MRFWTQLLRFAWLEAQSCLFAVALFAGLLVAYVVPLPVARYDALLVWCVVVTLGFWALGLETWREVLVIVAFHLLGLGLEVFKVHVGSWSYPEAAVTKVWDVPLFSGFMYAAVGSYVCQAWRRLALRVSGFEAWPTTVVAVLVYANFFTHHWVVDLRVPLAVLALLVLRRTWVHFTVGDARYRMPLAVSFGLIGLFLWIAENLATYLGAWKYPGQLEVWEAVHTSKIGSWALLVTMSFVLVAAVKRWEGVLYAGSPVSHDSLDSLDSPDSPAVPGERGAGGGDQVGPQVGRRQQLDRAAEGEQQPDGLAARPHRQP